MKMLFIEAKYKGNIELGKGTIDKLPENIGLVTTVQFAEQLKDIKKQLEKQNKKIFIGKGKQIYEGQILGCDISSAEKIKDNIDCFLYIGSGQFHPLALTKTKKKIFTFNPLTKIFKELSKQEIENYLKRRKGAYLKYLSSKNIGIIVSTKPGQKKLKEAIELKEKLGKKGKNSYIFIADDIDVNQLENFPFIDCWVNTSCPRIVEDKKGIIDIGEAKWKDWIKNL